MGLEQADREGFYRHDLARNLGVLISTVDGSGMVSIRLFLRCQ